MNRKKNNPQAILKQLADLETMPTEDLRKLWDTLHEPQSASEPKAKKADNIPAAVRHLPRPPRFNRQFLIKRLAYRVQELAFGGLEESTRRRMDRLLDDEGYDNLGVKSRPKKTKPGDALLPGTLLAREWQGERHEVIVGEDRNFEYRGIPYRSLSAVARAITGTRWNGPKFFGCREASR